MSMYSYDFMGVCESSFLRNQTPANGHARVFLYKVLEKLASCITIHLKRETRRYLQNAASKTEENYAVLTV